MKIVNGKIRFTTDSADIETYKQGRRTLYRDKRSYEKDGMWYVHPVGESVTNSIYIVCPYCGELHSHGKASGHRVSHCKNDNNPGYVIMLGGENNGE